MADTLYIVLLSEAGELLNATIELDNLPDGVNGNAVDDGIIQTIELVHPFTTDFDRFWAITKNIGENRFGELERGFLHTVASAWNNFLPSREPKDLFIGGIEGRIQVIRTDPVVASGLRDSLLNLGGRG